MIAGIHFNACGSTTNANWDQACPLGPNSSAVPPGLTANFSAFWTGAFYTHGKFNCTGTPYGTASAIRTAVMTQINWVFSNNQFTTSIDVPPGCDYYAFCPNPPSLSFTQTNVSCFGGSDGSATVTPAGSGPFGYSWSPVAGTLPTLSGLSAGTYTVTVTDAGTCTASGTVTITEPPQLTVSGVVQDEVAGSDGAIDVTVAGGTPPYTYAWSHGPATQDVSGLQDGTYILEVTDSNGCSEVDTFTVNGVFGLGAETEVMLSLYPNPSDGYFQLSAAGLAGETVVLSVSDISGKVLMEKTIQFTEAISVPVDIRIFPAGTYFLGLRSGKGTVIRPVIIHN
jgi:hypothetical protein